MAGTNTLDAVTSSFREIGLATLTARLAPLRQFCTQIATNSSGPRRPIEAAICTVASAPLTNPTDWQQGDGTIENRVISVDQIAQSFHISSADAQESLTVKSLVLKNSDALALQIWKVVSAALIETNFNAISWTGVLADLVLNSPKSASRFLLCDTAFYAAIMPTTLIGGTAGHPALTSGVHEISDWTAAGLGVRGFCGDPSALLVATGLPLSPKGVEKFVSQEILKLPQIDLSVMFSSWTDPGKRFFWYSLDVMLGVQKGDAAAAVLLK